MRPPVLRGVVERRVLVNHRVDPDVAARALPAPFRPQLVGDWAVAGVCLIRLGQLRPAGLPAAIGLRSENAAHRIAVAWDGPEGEETGVFIPRRDTGSRINALVGGRAFPGVHGLGRFSVSEDGTRTQVAFGPTRGPASIQVSVDDVPDLVGSELFPDLATASRFFERGSVGYSPSRHAGRFDGIELRTDAWRVAAGRMSSFRSDLLDGSDLFPAGSAVLDSVLLMRSVPVTWHPATTLTASGPVADHVGPAGQRGQRLHG